MSSRQWQIQGEEVKSVKKGRETFGLVGKGVFLLDKKRIKW